MGLLEKLGVKGDRPANPGHGARPSAAPRQVRTSNGLKDFLWLLGEVESGHLLDLGNAWQSTVSFFIERNFKVYAVDLLRDWRDWLAADDARRRAAARRAGKHAEVEPADHAALAASFLTSSLVYPPGTFHAVLAWDVFDYLPAEAAERVVARLGELLRPGGVLLAVFHSRQPEGFSRYRILDAQSVEVLPAPPLLPPVRIFQNREILALFEGFHSSKTYVGRDQLREGLFTR